MDLGGKNLKRPSLSFEEPKKRQSQGEKTLKANEFPKKRQEEEFPLMSETNGSQSTETEPRIFSCKEEGTKKEEHLHSIFPLDFSLSQKSFKMETETTNPDAFLDLTPRTDTTLALAKVPGNPLGLNCSPIGHDHFFPKSPFDIQSVASCPFDSFKVLELSRQDDGNGFHSIDQFLNGFGSSWSNESETLDQAEAEINGLCPEEIEEFF